MSNRNKDRRFIFSRHNGVGICMDVPEPPEAADISSFTGEDKEATMKKKKIEDEILQGILEAVPTLSPREQEAVRGVIRKKKKALKREATKELKKKRKTSSMSNRNKDRRFIFSCHNGVGICMDVPEPPEAADISSFADE